jgi:L-fuculose-phosphate aldolase
MDYSELCQQLIEYARLLNSEGLSAGQSGNISIRCKSGFLITPSGMDYFNMTIADIVLLDHEGSATTGQHRTPSSEWHFHYNIYRTRPDIHAVVHAHPPFCTTLACTGRDIPAFHYMVAIAGGDNIPLAPYALFGTEQLSKAVVSTLSQRQACLMANHGMVSLGADLPSAFKLAIEVEALAQQYCGALAIGDVTLLTSLQMDEVIAKFRNYGQRV